MGLLHADPVGIVQSGSLQPGSIIADVSMTTGLIVFSPLLHLTYGEKSFSMATMFDVIMGSFVIGPPLTNAPNEKVAIAGETLRSFASRVHGRVLHEP